MRITANLTSAISYTAVNEHGQSVTMDGSHDIGGTGAGPRPMEVVLMGLAGCSGIDVRLILQKMKQDVSDVTITIDAERAESVPAVFTKIHLHFVVTGTDLEDAKVALAVALSADKYCSVSMMLKETVEITHSHETIS